MYGFCIRPFHRVTREATGYLGGTPIPFNYTYNASILFRMVFINVELMEIRFDCELGQRYTKRKSSLMSIDSHSVVVFPNTNGKYIQPNMFADEFEALRTNPVTVAK